MRPVELAREACRRIGVEPFSTPIRGGTDGSRLTELGAPLRSNLFTGMQEIHGPLEWISLQDMAQRDGAVRGAGAVVERGDEAHLARTLSQRWTRHDRSAGSVVLAAQVKHLRLFVRRELAETMSCHLIEL